MNKLSDEKVAQLLAAFNSGMGVRTAAKAVGINKRTASLYLQELPAIPNCPCGLPITHQGWCKPRYNRSRKRQHFMASWHGEPMAQELDELCEWCFDKGDERKAVTMLAGVPLCGDCSKGSGQSRFVETKSAPYTDDAVVIAPVIRKKVDMPQINKIVVREEEPKPLGPVLLENHKPCACGCGNPLSKASPDDYAPGHEPQAPEPEPQVKEPTMKPKTKWGDCFAEFASIDVGQSLTVKLPEDGTRSQMNSALGMNSLTKKWRWSLTKHRDGTVTVVKLGTWAEFDTEQRDAREAEDEPPATKPQEVELQEPEEPKPIQITVRRKAELLIPDAQPLTQVIITPALAQAVWDALTLEQKAKVWDVDSAWLDFDDEMRMGLIHKILLVDKGSIP